MRQRRDHKTRTSPIIFTSRFSNSSFMRANAPSSVVQTGVKSAGCEKRIVQLLPIHWWKSISPLVVWAWKLGAAPSQRQSSQTPGQTTNPSIQGAVGAVPA
jgi:hypothetical protein